MDTPFFRQVSAKRALVAKRPAPAPVAIIAAVALELFWERFSVGSAAAFGLLLGSFANVLAFRVPRGISIVLPGSFCTACGRSVRPFDNVPVLSYLLLRGRCRDCHAPFSIRYALVEACAGVMAALMVARFGLTGEALTFIGFGLLLMVLFLTDYDFHTLPDELTVTGIVAGLALAGASQLGIVVRTRGAATFPDAALGVTTGAGVLLTIMFVYQAIRNRRGMGVGDVKLLACIGAFMGAEMTLATLLVAVVLGSVGGLLFVAVRGGGLSTALPFGTYLAVAALGVLFLYPS